MNSIQQKIMDEINTCKVAMEHNNKVLEDLESQLKEITSREPFVPTHYGDEYYSISSNGFIFRTSYSGNLETFGQVASGNVFPDKESAEKALAIRKATYKVKSRIKELNEGWVPDFSNTKQKKHHLLLTYGKLNLIFCYKDKIQPSYMYLKSEELALKLITELGQELFLIMGE